jgi:hypothetical protein
LEGLSLGALSLRLENLEPMRLSGWRHFSIGLLHPDGSSSIDPVAEGIYSVGGKGVQPWIEIANYRRIVSLKGGETIDLRSDGLEPVLFKYFHDLLEPGSHIMLWYEGDSGRETDIALQRGVPPVITSLGIALFRAGFYSIRNFHLPEGGHEGGRKLWGERPLHKDSGDEWKQKACRDAMAYFLDPIRPNLLDMELAARKATIDLLRSIELHRDVPDLYLGFEGACDALHGGRIAVEDWPSLVAKLSDDPGILSGAG